MLTSSTRRKVVPDALSPRRSLCPLAVVVVASVLLPGGAEAAIDPPAIIDNGTVELGIQPEGNLIVGSGGNADLPGGRGITFRTLGQ